MLPSGYVQYGAGTIQEQIDSGKSICILTQEITQEDVMSKSERTNIMISGISHNGVSNGYKHHPQITDVLHKVEKVFNPNKIGRNDKCPCGSGKKYKKCCGGNV